MLDAARRVSDSTVELSALSGGELEPLVRFLADAPASLEGFDYISVHAPAKGWSRPERELSAVLGGLPDQVAAIVMHPDSMSELAPYAELGERLALENMDTRKNDGRTVDELEVYFAALPESRFCFDIAHAGLHDPTMTLAHELLDAFGERLVEVHLSSIRGDGRHVELRDEDRERFSAVLERCAGVPWILEAPLPRA